MKISELLENGAIILDLKGQNKKDIIDEMAQALNEKNVLSDKGQFIEDIWKREKEFSTAIGDGIAIPHAKSSVVIKPSIVFAKSNHPVDFDSLDKKPTFLFFMIAAPVEGKELHLMALAKLSRKLVKAEFRDHLMKVTKPFEVIKAFKEIE